MPRPKHQDPVRTTRDESALEGWTETHPSYGIARLSRFQGGASNYFGSSVDCQNGVSLTILRAEHMRDTSLNNDWYFAREKLIEVNFTPSQFAQLITNMNVGEGACCTIDSVGGEYMPPCPQREVRQEHEKEFAAKMRKCAEKADSAIAKLDVLLTPGKGIKKGDLQELRREIWEAARQLADSAPFAQKQFNEALDKATTEAKAEIDSHFGNALVKIGGEKARETLGLDESPALRLGDANKKDV